MKAVELRRRGKVAAVLIAAMAVMVPTTALAAWNDSEVLHSPLGTIDCGDADGTFQTKGVGRLLSGGLLGIDLDTLAAVRGMTLTHDGDTLTADPASAPSAGADARANPLTVAALNAVTIDLNGVTTTLGALLAVSTDAGVIGQYAKASSDGHSVGASGALTQSGAIDLGAAEGEPNLASINLRNLLTASLGAGWSGALSQVTDLRLDIGVLAGRTAIDGCAQAWGATTSESVQRTYLASGLSMELDSPLVGNLVTSATTAVTTLQAAVNGVASNTGVLSAISNGVTDLLSSLGLVSATTTVTASIDLSSLTHPQTGLLHATLTDPDAVVTVDLDEGTVAIDLVALLAKTYGTDFSNGINGLPPNTELLISDEVITTLTATLNDVLTAWVSQVNSALNAARNAVAVRAQIQTRLAGFALANIAVPATGTASLANLMAGNVPAQVTVVGVPLGNLLTPLINGTGKIVGNAVDAALPTASNLTSALVSTAVNPLITMVSNLFVALFVPQGTKPAVLSLGVNAQNRPTTTVCLDTGMDCVPPADWSSLPEGRFDVAALRIGVLDALGGVTQLYLGRGSAGATCPTAALDPRCGGY